MPMGFCNFKLEGREYGESRLLEEIFYYLAKHEAYLEIREMLYLHPYPLYWVIPEIHLSNIISVEMP